MVATDWKEPRTPNGQVEYLRSFGLEVRWKTVRRLESPCLTVRKGDDVFEVSEDTKTATAQAAYESCQERGWI